MRVFVYSLRVLRLVLLGGALGFLWMLLTAAGSSASEAGDDRSLPLLGEVPVVSDLASPTPQEKSSGQPKSLPHNVVRSVTQPVERTVSTVTDVADQSLATTEQVGSTVVDTARATTRTVAAAPSLAPITQPVVDEVVDPVLSGTQDVTTTVVDGTRSTLREVDDAVGETLDDVADEVVGGTVEDAVDVVVPALGDTMPATTPRDDTTTPIAPATAVGTGPTADQGTLDLPERVVAAPDNPEAGTATVVAAAVEPSALETLWTMDEPEATSDDAVARRSIRPDGPGDEPLPASPLGIAPGCAPGAGAAAGAQHDLAAYRSPFSLPVMTTVPTGGSGHTASVPGPSVLPGFSPE